VGLPLDLVVVRQDARAPIVRRRIEVDDPYFRNLSARWSMLLNESRASIPDPPFLRGEDPISDIEDRLRAKG
jgi:putative proteasome-type protease